MKKIQVLFDGVTHPIRFWRAPDPNLPAVRSACDDPHCSIPTTVYHHSPDGIEWGYGGSGPADAALNILHYFLPPGCDGLPSVKLWKGRCSQIAWDFHQTCKIVWIATLPKEGGEIDADEFNQWLRNKIFGWIDNQTQKLAGSIQEDCDD